MPNLPEAAGNGSRATLNSMCDIDEALMTALSRVEDYDADEDAKTRKRRAFSLDLLRFLGIAAILIHVLPARCPESTRMVRARVTGGAS